MSHPVKPGHTRVTIDLAPGQTVTQALGLGATSGKADAYLRDLQAAVRELDLPKLPKNGAELRTWLLSTPLSDFRAHIESPAKPKPEDGAEFWRTGLRDAALELTKAHLNVVTPESFTRAVYEAGLLDGEAKKTAYLGLAAQEATGCGDSITKPEDPTAFVGFLISYGEGQAGEIKAYNEQGEADAYERGRVAGLRAAVWPHEIRPRVWIAVAPGGLKMDPEGWRQEQANSCTFPTREEAQAAADAAPNWWEGAK